MRTTDAVAGVYRAPMRSRRDDVEPWLAIERALELGLCGTGEVTDERSARLLERFAGRAGRQLRLDPGR